LSENASHICRNPASVSYISVIVTISLSRTISEINGNFRQKSPIFPTPVYIVPPLKGLPLKLGIGAWVRKNLNDGATR